MGRSGQARAALPLLVLSIAALSGCVGNSPAVGPQVDAGGLLSDVVSLIGEPILQDHDHADDSLHAASFGLGLASYHSGYGSGRVEDIPAGGGFNELAIRGDYVYIVRGGSLPGVDPRTNATRGFLGVDEVGGFSIIYIADPAAPVLVGEYKATSGDDIEVSEDGNWVFLSTQRNPVQRPQTYADNTFGAFPRGTYIINVTDKTRPSFENFVPQPLNGPHTLTYHVQDGRQLLISCTYDLTSSTLAYVGGDGLPGLPSGENIPESYPLTQRVMIHEFVERGGKRTLDLLSIYQRNDLQPADKWYRPHDAVVERHPITGQDIMYVAYWDLGVVLVDISDPRNPSTISTYNDFAPSAIAQMHRAAPFPALINGRHVTVGEPEIVTAAEAGQITLIDTTDPTSPRKISYWTIPGGLVIDRPFIFSPHNFDLTADGRIALAYNHGGVWLIDASGDNLTDPKAVGFYVPHVHREKTGYSAVWGQFFKGDHLYVSDGRTGLHVVEYEGEKWIGGPQE